MTRTLFCPWNWALTCSCTFWLVSRYPTTISQWLFILIVVIFFLDHHYYITTNLRVLSFIDQYTPCIHYPVDWDALLNIRLQKFKFIHVFRPIPRVLRLIQCWIIMNRLNSITIIMRLSTLPQITPAYPRYHRQEIGTLSTMMNCFSDNTQHV